MSRPVIGERVADRREDGAAVVDEVEAVGGQDAIERAGREQVREVRDRRRERCRRECPEDGVPVAGEGAGVSVQGGDVAVRTEQVGQRERESALPRPELQPSRAGAVTPARMRAT